MAAPLNVVGWFFPVEIDLTWAEASALEPLLAQPPRPLWISVYESANVGPEVLLQRLMKGYSSDVGMKAVLQFDKAACDEVEKSLPRRGDRLNTKKRLGYIRNCRAYRFDTY